MECRYCGGEISPDDPLYPKIHYRCANKVYKDLERFKMIRVIKQKGTFIQAEFRRSFLNLLDRELVKTHSHIVTDSTVSEDILELWAVCKLVPTHVPKGTPQNKVFTYCEFIFNALMSQRYGGPVPEDKMFHSRAKELAKEIHIIETDKTQFDLIRRIGRYAA